jgi:hypothetical protein
VRTSTSCLGAEPLFGKFEKHLCALPLVQRTQLAGAANFQDAAAKEEIYAC